MARRKLSDINKLKGTNSRQRLRLRCIKGDRIPGWDRLHEQHGCPLSATDVARGSIHHIFWSCPAAQTMWRVLLDGWAPFDNWDPDRAPLDQLKAAVFTIELHRFPKSLWVLLVLASIAPTDVDVWSTEGDAKLNAVFTDQDPEIFVSIHRIKLRIGDAKPHVARSLVHIGAPQSPLMTCNAMKMRKLKHYTAVR